MDFLDPSVLGPLFRFNREHDLLEERGRPQGYRNLAGLQERIRPFLLRRRESDVETELPDRTDRNFFVSLTSKQQEVYGDFATTVAKLQAIAKRRPLTQQEQEKLLRTLAMMRMTGDTNFIPVPENPSSSKIPELEEILEECRDNSGVKVIVFSEWERMLQLVKDVFDRVGIGCARHTGSVPQRRRRAEILSFRTDPHCRVFLSTDSGSTGLNLQNASVVINCDLPWNPARLEQRIARAWRKHLTQRVTVINLVARDTLEERMLETLANKQALSDGVLDSRGDLDSVPLRQGSQAFFEKLEQSGIRSSGDPVRPGPVPTPMPADRALGFAAAVAAELGSALVGCEERFPREGVHSVLYVIVEREAGRWRERLIRLHEQFFRDSDPLAPVRLEVVDRESEDAVERLIVAGLVVRSSRASRPLTASEGTPDGCVALGETERVRVTDLESQAARQVRMACVLESGGFLDEARAALLTALVCRARSLAVKHRLPEPRDVEESFRTPHSRAWGVSLPDVCRFVSDPTAALQDACSVLGKVEA